MKAYLFNRPLGWGSARPLRMHFLSAVTLLAAAVLAGCGGGGGDSGGTGASASSTNTSTTSNVSAGGIWQGSDTVSGLSMTGIVTESGQLQFIRQDGVQFYGSVSVSGNTVTGSVQGVTPTGTVFPDGSKTGTGTFSGTVSARSSLAGAISFRTSAGTNSTGTVSLAYNAAYATPSSLAAVAGTYRDTVSNAAVVVTASGALSSQDPVSGCSISGTVALIDANYDAYSVQYAFSGCSVANGYGALNGTTASGLAYLDSTGSPVTAVIGVANSAAGYALTRAYPRVAGSGTSGPALSVSAGALDFGTQAVGTISATRSFVVTNSGNAPLAISTVSLGGAAFASFAQTNSCAGATIPANGTCSVLVTFTPTGVGAAVAGVSLSSNASATATFVALTGIGNVVASPGFSLAGSVSGLAAPGLVLNGNGVLVPIPAGGTQFSIGTFLTAGSNYAVTVQSQPSGLNCLVANGSGSGIAANVWNIAVTCSTAIYKIGGTLSGLSAGERIVLLNNAGDPLTLQSNGSFAFNALVKPGASYAVTIGTQPNLQSCTLTSGSGSGVSAHVTSIVVTCAPPEISASLTVSTGGASVKISVVASSNFGITRVAASLDGQSLGSLTATNGCSPGRCGSQAYNFTADAVAAGSGAHTVTVQITNGNGFTGTLTQQISISNPPRVTVSVVDGAIVYGTLALTGTASTDKAGVTVNTVISLNGVQILNTTSNTFSVSQSLASFASGSYALSIVATDSTGTITNISNTVTVASSASLAFTPVLSLGLGGALLAQNSTTFVYSKDGVSHLNGVGGDVVLQPSASTTSLYNWQTTNQNAYADALSGDRPGASSSAYQWTSTGVRSNLSVLAGSTSIYDQVVSAHDGWVLWASSYSGSGWSAYSLYNVVSRATLVVGTPAGASYIGNTQVDFFVSSGLITLYYWANTGSTDDIYRWSQGTGVSTRVTSGSAVASYPQTDGTWVAWQSTALGQSCGFSSGVPPTAPACSLIVAPAAGGSQQTLSLTLKSFSVAGGQVAWQEAAQTGGGIKVYSSGGTTTITNNLAAALVGTGGGYVLYTLNSKLYLWDQSNGSQVLFDGLPVYVAISGKVVYFTNGNSRALYRVQLP